MIKTILKTLLLLAAVGYLVFALIKVSRPAQEMVCTGIEYVFTDSNEVSLIDRKMTEELLLKHKISPKGQTFADINNNTIEELLEESPYIDSVTCYHTATGKLCIRIATFHPILHVYANDGDEFYVDKSGIIMPAGGINTDLPIVTGHVSRKYASTKLLNLSTILQNDEYWGDMTQQINIDQDGNVEITPRICEQKIKLGEPKNLEAKLQRVRTFYEKAMPKTGWNKYNVVNATYDNQIICTKEK